MEYHIIWIIMTKADYAIDAMDNYIKVESQLYTFIGVPLYTEVSLFQEGWNGGVPLYTEVPLYTVEPLYSNPLKRGHLCIQWNPSIPTP